MLRSKKNKDAKVFIGSDKSTLAFPKFQKKKSGPKTKKAKRPEEVIQSQIEGLLKSYGLKFFHIPDNMLFFLMRNPAVPQWIRNLVKEYFKDLPDIIAFHKNQEGHNFCLLLELKTEVGSLSTGQKRFKSGLNVIVTYGLEEAKAAVEEFIEFVDNKA